MRELPVCYLVLPCYNEVAVLPETLPLFREMLLQMKHSNLVHPDSCILCVDDGSQDGTWDVLTFYTSNTTDVKAVRETRNFGHQNALFAGMQEAYDLHADCVVTMDCDGQDDIAVLPEMLQRYLEGYDVVYGVRKSRGTDSIGKRWSAKLYYKLLHRFGADVVEDHADYRLLGRNALQALLAYPERNLYLRGLVPLVGFDDAVVYYERKVRQAGKTKYSLKKMISFGVDGITSFSVKPLVWIGIFGFVTAILSFIGCIWSVCTHLSGQAVPGWASMTCIVCFVCGVQMICLGVIGIYVGKIYLEVKQRPRFFIRERTYEKDGE